MTPLSSVMKYSSGISLEAASPDITFPNSLVTSPGWEATSWLDSGPHDFWGQHDYPGLLLHQGAVHGAGLQRTDRQDRKNQDLCSSNHETTALMDRQAGSCCCAGRVQAECSSGPVLLRVHCQIPASNQHRPCYVLLRVAFHVK